MKTVLIIAAIVYVVLALSLYACIKVAGDCSREEEKRDGKL